MTGGRGVKGTGAVLKAPEQRAAGGDGGDGDGGHSWNLHPLKAALPEAQPHFQSSVRAVIKWRKHARRYGVLDMFAVLFFFSLEISAKSQNSIF